MTSMYRFPMRNYLVALLLVLCAGCDQASDARPVPLPEPIVAGDECHVCGMIIRNYPGPKGEAVLRAGPTFLKFCSTRDLFSFLLQPESQTQVAAAFVHDMGATEWQQPSDSAFVDARLAWYVVEHPRRGAMGPTLASFEQREAAVKFSQEYGGRLLRFQDITLELLGTLGSGGHPSSH